MAIQTPTMKATLATAYGTAATSAALYTTTPGASAGTEPSGGSPAYARIPLTWSGSNGVVSASGTFNVPSGTTVVGAGVTNSGGTYLDGGSLTSQAFASQGTYVLTLTFTES